MLELKSYRTRTCSLKELVADHGVSELKSKILGAVLDNWCNKGHSVMWQSGLGNTFLSLSF